MSNETSSVGLFFDCVALLHTKKVLLREGRGLWTVIAINGIDSIAAKARVYQLQPIKGREIGVKSSIDYCLR